MPFKLRLEVAEPAIAPKVPVRTIRPAVRVVPGVTVTELLLRSSLPAMVRLSLLLILLRLATTKVCSSLVKSTGVLPLPSAFTPQVDGASMLPLAFEYKTVEVVSTAALLVQVPPV